jgi:phage gp29-like protein
MKKEAQKIDARTLSARVIALDSALSSFMGYMPNPDEVLRDTGERISVYREMRTDPRIKSLLALVKSTILEFAPRIEQGGSKPQVYKTVSEFMPQSLLYGLEKRLLSAIDYGYSVVEVVWENSQGWWKVADVVLRKPERFAFDAEGRLKYKDPNNAELLDLYNQSYKWLVFRHDKDAENPYGTSALKSCYWAWKFKKAGSQFWIMAAEKFSVPSILALFDTTEPEDKIKARALDLSEMLATVQSGSGAALANIKDVKLLTSPEKVSEFRSLMEWCDQQISYGITGQSLATQEAEFGSRAQASVHKDVLTLLAKGVCRDMTEVLQRLVSYVVELNYGPDEAEPQIRFDLEEHTTWDELMQAIDRGIPISKQSLYTRYGVPEPTGDDDAFIRSSQTGMDPLALAMADESKKKARRPLF